MFKIFAPKTINRVHIKHLKEANLHQELTQAKGVMDNYMKDKHFTISITQCPLNDEFVHVHKYNPIEYIKSAPFLMSFMNYKVKDNIDDFLKGKKVCITPEERNKYKKRMPTAFLKRSQINAYQPLPDTNARLNLLFDEIFEVDGTKKRNPELLLWIPPANKYYNAGARNQFAADRPLSAGLSSAARTKAMDHPAAEVFQAHCGLRSGKCC